MKKTLGLLALTVGLVAGGCALLPHGPVANLAPKDAQWSGPVTLTVNVPQEMRTVQGVRSGVKLIECFVIEPDTSAVVQRAGANIIATSSVTGTGATASVTLPAMPADGGYYWLKINGYNNTWNVLKNSIISDNMAAVAAGTLPVASMSTVIAQGEVLVAPTRGVPINQSITMYNCVAPSANLYFYDEDGDGDSDASTGMVYSSSFSGITAPTGGLPIRWFNFDLKNMLKGSGVAGSANGAKVRLTIKAPTAGRFTSSDLTFAVASNAATVSWAVADWSKIPSSSAAPYSVATVSGAAWTPDPTGQYIYADFDLTCSTGVGSSSIASTSLSNLSAIIPKELLLSGYVVTLTDYNNPVSLSGNGTL